MKTTKAIHQALRRRGYVASEIIGLKNHIEQLSKLLHKFENEKKVLDFALNDWDQFEKNKKRL